LPAWRIWLSVLRDLRGSFLHEHLANLTGGRSMTRHQLPSSALLRRGAVFGCAIVLIWITFRALQVGAWLGSPSLLVPWLLFAPAGYVGARTTGKFGGGIWAGLVAGLIALLTIPGDYVLFHRVLPGGVVPTILTLTAAATLLASVGMPPAKAGGAPTLKLVAAQAEVTITRRGHFPVPLSVGVFTTAVNGPFEIHANRADYDSPIVLTQWRDGQQRRHPRRQGREHAQRRSARIRPPPGRRPARDLHLRR